MTKLPNIEWKAVDPSAEFSPYKATDEHGNRWSMTANREWIQMRTPDDQYYSGWSEQECWNQYMVEELQAALLDANSVIDGLRQQLAEAQTVAASWANLSHTQEYKRNQEWRRQAAEALE